MQLAGNPSLIDPTKAEPKPRDDSQASDPKVDAALAKLPEEDRSLARKQRICPVTEAPLGSMGVPPKVDVDGRTVFICCEGCRRPLLDDPEKYLAVLEEAAKETPSQSDAGVGPAAPGLPSIGPIQLLEDDR
jgi:hypothetical protein